MKAINMIHGMMIKKKISTGGFSHGMRRGETFKTISELVSRQGGGRAVELLDSREMYFGRSAVTRTDS